MIVLKTGDILTEDVEALVNTVNCVGVMGRGIALQFKQSFPKNFASYAAACKRNEVQPGRLHVYETGLETYPLYIVNFPTKRHWRNKSRMEDIEAGLNALAAEVRSRNIRSIAVPPLGSGLGGLDWPLVRSRIVTALQDLDDLRVVIFEPIDSDAGTRIKRSTPVPKMTPGRAALVGLMHRYLGGYLDPFVTLLEVHKLMYFMQSAGEPLRLNFTKGRYGPYGENLRHVMNAIEGHFVSGYADGGDVPDKELNLVRGAQERARTFLELQTQSLARFARVSELVDGFESPFGLELLSTVHWVICREQAGSVDDVIAKIYAWNQRKKQFSPRQIKLAIDMLSRKGWIDMLGVPGP